MNQMGTPGAASGGRDGDRTIRVKFTKHQIELLERLKAEKTWGLTLEEVVRSVFRQFMQDRAATRNKLSKKDA